MEAFDTKPFHPTAAVEKPSKGHEITDSAKEEGTFLPLPIFQDPEIFSIIQELIDLYNKNPQGPLQISLTNQGYSDNDGKQLEISLKTTSTLDLRIGLTKLKIQILTQKAAISFHTKPPNALITLTPYLLSNPLKSFCTAQVTTDETIIKEALSEIVEKLRPQLAATSSTSTTAPATATPAAA